jgi:hypothetical protein
MHAICLDAGLGSGQRDGLAPEGIDGHGGERNGLLLARGEQYVDFALRGVRRGGDLVGQPEQGVRDARHGGDDRDDLVASELGFENAAGHVFDALRSAY